MIDGTDTSSTRNIPVDLAECLRILKSIHSDRLSPAEKRDLDDASTIIDISYQALRELCQRIEKCGASVELTHAVTLCSDLASAIGNRWNLRDKYALERVRTAINAASSR